MIHQLKCDSKFFEDVASGEKTFEVRKNDRDFRVGDFLALNELTPHACNRKGEHKETGRCCLVYVNYILNDSDYCKEDFVVLGIEACSINVIGIGLESEIYDSMPVKEYQQLEEQGKLIKLPCNVGSDIYVITFDCEQEQFDIRKTKIIEVNQNCNGLFFRTLMGIPALEINDFGKTVFLTKSEAEAKLKELRGGENGR